MPGSGWKRLVQGDSRRKEIVMRTLEHKTANEIVAISRGIDPGRFEQEHADAHLMAVDDHEGAAAECSLWWSQTPPLGHQRVGLIGHYSATNDSAALMLLAAACDRLRRAGCMCAVGPMDGSTWRRYRFVTDAGTEPAFFLEPQNPPEWPQQFMLSGFSPLASYFSALNVDLSYRDPRLTEAENRLRSSGVVLRSSRAGEMSDTLRRMYRVACVAFKNSFLYTELPHDDFLRQYERLLTTMRPELLLLAEQETELAGFVLAIPDVLHHTGNSQSQTFIVKTVAILPRSELRGLGSLLVGRAQQIGRELGFKRCIGALMHERNTLVRNLSATYGKPIRRYTLFAKDLVA
jgi:GNAT superfamily N-acetyltransferase